MESSGVTLYHRLDGPGSDLGRILLFGRNIDETLSRVREWSDELSLDVDARVEGNGILVKISSYDSEEPVALDGVIRGVRTYFEWVGVLPQFAFPHGNGSSLLVERLSEELGLQFSRTALGGNAYRLRDHGAPIPPTVEQFRRLG